MTESANSVSPLRVLIVGIVLVAVGVVAGAFCAVTVVMLLSGLTSLGDLTGFGLFVGSLGAFLAPIAGFSILRRVALGRAIFWTSVGTVLGGLLGLGLADVLGGDMVLLGPLAGFGIAAFRLWTETTELGRRRRISKGAA
jgi:hypothetical protein